MPSHTTVIFRNGDEEEVDRFEYDHPISKEVKYHLEIFLALNFELHPDGCPTTYNRR
jgi:hypothetical protein